MAPVLSLSDVTFGYGATPVLDGVTLAVEPGEFAALVGPNGSGKSTLLRIVLGVLRPQHGTVRLLGADPADLHDRARIGYVPQRDTVDSVFPLEVLDIVLMGRYDRIGLGRRPTDDDRARALQALDQVGLRHLAHFPLATLSGGQKQRTLIARALVGEPDLLVLDEPTNGMDLVATAQILGLVRDLHEQDRLTVVMVSHALNEVANYVERIALVDESGFRIGSIEDVMTESSLSAMYGIPVEVSSFDGHRIVLARRTRAGGGAGEPSQGA